MSAQPLPSARTAPVPLPRPHSRQRHLRAVGQSTLAVDFGRHDAGTEFGPQHTATADLPPVREWSHRFLVGLLEALGGVRPATQVERHLTLELREKVHRLHSVAVRRGSRPPHPSRVLKVRARTDVDGVAEVSAVVHHLGRVRAIALRMNGCDGRWRVTVLEMG